MTRPWRSAASDPAFVFFTSGSTGEPKGIRHSHRSASAFVRAYTAAVRAPGTRILSTSPFQFAGAFCDFVYAMAAGATLVLPSPSQLAQPRQLIELGVSAAVDAVHAVPALWSILLGGTSADLLSTWHLRHVLCTGEPLTGALVAELTARWPSIRIWNDYGQSETLGCSVHEVGAADAVLASMPIGRPLPGVCMTVRDPDTGALLPDGSAGELVVIGDNVFDGYVGAGETDPNHGMFPTGDLARLRREGVFHCLGRRDGQVKIRGNRLELAEVEAAILTAAWVVRAVVVHANDVLHAFVTTADGDRPPALAIRKLCSERLPTYAVPKHVTFVDDLPHNTNGKVDRLALRARALAGAAS